MNALEVKNLTKTYPSFKLDGVSFNVKEGHIVGLIGRNGVGKSTTLKSIMRLISATGEVKVFEKSVIEDENYLKETIGYVGGGFKFYQDTRLDKISKTVASFYPQWDQTKYDSYLSVFNLDKSKKISQLSDGMKVKFALALALSRNARLLILDEPTSGLDPVSREEFCDIILSLAREQGVSVLFSTHVTSDLMRIADDVVYISNGKVLADTSLDELLSKYSVAKFSTLEQAQKAQAKGIKQVKNGFEGLVPQGRTIPIALSQSKATPDDIMIHFELMKQGEPTDD